MSSRRRSAVTAFPDSTLRGSKRQKISDDNPNRASSRSDPELPDEPDGTAESHAESEAGFEGDDLQTAQDKIMSELTRLKDHDGQEVSYPFIGKPDRNLYRDYYEIIQHPVSLRSIQKRVRGTDSRKNTSRTTAYPTWQSFEEEVSYIWRNARDYNEDDSEIAILAGVLEDHFRRRVAEAKKVVPESFQVDGAPEIPRIKLKVGTPVSPMTQRLTLTMPGQTTDTVSKDDGQPTDVTAEDESLSRRQYVARARSTGQAIRESAGEGSPKKHLDSSRSSTATTPSFSEQQHKTSVSTRGLLNSASTESALATTTSRHSPNVLFEASAEVARHASLGSAHTSSQAQVGSSPMDSFLRRPHQDPNVALIRNVEILTHASLSLRSDFCLDIPPSPLVSQQNITVHLPPSHNLLTVRLRLAASTPDRQVKIVAFVGTQRLLPSGEATILSYDIHLHPGMMKVDFEAIAGPARGIPKSIVPGSDIDYERVTLFFNLLR
ncbi:Bromodomain [Penicillium bovifimosum]|uniref:Bromodomain n=1 Tax=Penicillium bovifimosum TaxID=126998 RepID=A0A9W9H7G5_9EURO|nr:Bromodomain [Penicillium bovifimosum]KAJ5139116.1 Bromodomain [Penicillium bovifimosum]